MMKRNILFAAAFLLISWAATSCDAISGCKVCRDVTYENGSVIDPGSDTEYCGTDLINKEKTAPIHIGTQIIKVECR
jgi:hypothetical protein